MNPLTCMIAALAVGATASAAAGAGENPQPPAAAGRIEIIECAVYSPVHSGLRFDCADAARRVCDGAPDCELPIGMSLSNGTDIDPGADEKVKVRYACAGRERVQGPHLQDDHAAILLRCP